MLFKELKELFIVKLILKIYILSLLTVVEIDVLDFILSVYLVQKYLDKWYLVIYYSAGTLKSRSDLYCSIGVPFRLILSIRSS